MSTTLAFEVSAEAMAVFKLVIVVVASAVKLVTTVVCAAVAPAAVLASPITP